MKTIKKTTIIALLIVMFIFTCFACVSTQKNTNSFVSKFNNTVYEQIENAKNNLVVINAEYVVSYEILENPDIDNEKAEMVGFLINSQFVLALDHCVNSILEEDVYYTPFGEIPIKNKVLESKYYIGEQELFWVGSIGDIALLKFVNKNESISAFPFEFANSDYLKVGDDIIIIGFSSNIVFNIKTGVVSSLIGNLDYIDAPETIEEAMDLLRESDGSIFITDAAVNPGDSGSPVFVINSETGLLEIIGLSAAKSSVPSTEGVGYIYKSNWVNEQIELILDGFYVL